MLFKRPFPPPPSDASQVSRARTNFLLLGILLVLGFFAYEKVQADDAAAVRSMNYSQCWTDSCKHAVSDRYTRPY
jgi:hypothetical protein